MQDKMVFRQKKVFSTDNLKVRYERPTLEQLGIRVADEQRELYIKQIDAEYRIREEKYRSCMESYEEAARDRTEGRTSYGSLLIGLKVREYAKAIEEHATSASAGRRHTLNLLYSSNLEYAVIANIALSTVVEAISREQNLGSLSMRIARALEDEINFRRLQAASKQAAFKTRERMKTKRRYISKRESLSWSMKQTDTEMLRWTDKERMMIGQGLIVILNVKMGWFDVTHEVRYRANKKRRAALLQPTQQLASWLKDAQQRLALELRPSFEPMIVPPICWSRETLLCGGYLTRVNKPLYLVKTRNKQYLQRLKQCDMPIVYKAINIIQNTAFCTNTRVTKLCRTMIDTQFKYAADIKLPILHHREMSEEVKRDPAVDTDPDRLYWYQKDCAAFARDEKAQECKRISFMSLLSQAERYAEYDEFYNVWQADARFRLYPVSRLNCQGADSTKAFLQYAEPLALGEHGLKWLEIAISGLFGVDKVDIPTRLAWVQEHKEDIKRLAADPMTHHEFWATADKPLQAYAMACELSEAWALEDPSQYLSRLSVPLDGSCSGLQILAMALRCEETGKNVNLVPNDKPADIYNVVAMMVQKELEDIVAGRSLKELKADSEKRAYEYWRKRYPDAEYGVWLEVLDIVRSTGARPDNMPVSEVELRDLCNLYHNQLEAYAWLQFGIDRKTVKRNVMTFCYSAEEFGFCDQIREDIIDPAYKEYRKRVSHGDSTAVWYFHGVGRRAAKLLASHVYPAVKRTVVRAAQFMDWLKQVAKLIAKSNKPIHWTTPNNARVEMAYYKQNKQRIKCQLMGVRNDLTVSVDSDVIDGSKAVSAIAPNFVHSLDSAHLQRVVVKAHDKYNIKHFSLVHDSFATHAGKTEELFHAIREALVEMFREHDVVQELCEELTAQVDEKYSSEIPQLPTYGNLDYDKVLETTFSFI